MISSARSLKEALRRPAVPQGLVITCPRKIRFDGVLRALRERGWIAGPDYPLISDEEDVEHGPAIPQAGNDEMIRTFVNGSYLALSAAEASGLITHSDVPLDFLRGVLDLMRVMVCSHDLLDFAAGLESMRQKWGADFFSCISDLSAAIPQGEGTEKNTLFRNLLECVAVAVVCRVGGITRDLMDFKAMGIYLREQVGAIAHNIIDYTVAVFRVVSSGNFTDFLSRVNALVSDSASKRASAIDQEFKAIQAMALEPHEMQRARLRLDLFVTELTTISRKAETDGATRLMAYSISLAQKILLQIDEFNRRESLSTNRKEPLFLFCRSPAGSGKSLNNLAIISALARLFDISADQARAIVYNWSVGHEWQEGFHHGVRAISMDEVFSVNADKDPSVWPIANDLLRMVSPVPAIIPCAFENAKGKFSTASVVLIAANSNAPDVTIGKIYEGGAYNIRRRAYEVLFKPKGVCVGKDGTSFVPSKMPEAERTLDGLASVMDVQVTSFLGGVKKVEFTGDILKYADWLHDTLADRLFGEGYQVASWLSSLATYKTVKPNPTPLPAVTIEAAAARVKERQPPSLENPFDLLNEPGPAVPQARSSSTSSLPELEIHIPNAADLADTLGDDDWAFNNPPNSPTPPEDDEDLRAEQLATVGWQRSDDPAFPWRALGTWLDVALTPRRPFWQRRLCIEDACDTFFQAVVLVSSFLLWVLALVHTQCVRWFGFDYADVFNGVFSPWRLSRYSVGFLIHGLLGTLVQFRVSHLLIPALPRALWRAHYVAYPYMLIVAPLASLNSLLAGLSLRGRIYALKCYLHSWYLFLYLVHKMDASEYERMCDLLSQPPESFIIQVAPIHWIPWLTFPTTPATDALLPMPYDPPGIPHPLRRWPFSTSYLLNSPMTGAVMPIWFFFAAPSFVKMGMLAFPTASIFSLGLMFSLSNFYSHLYGGALLTQYLVLSDMRRDVHSRVSLTFDQWRPRTLRYYIDGWRVPVFWHVLDERPIGFFNAMDVPHTPAIPQSSLSDVVYYPAGFALLGFMVANWREVLIHLALLTPRVWWQYWTFRVVHSHVVHYGRALRVTFTNRRLVVTNKARFISSLIESKWSQVRDRIAHFMKTPAFGALLSFSMIGAAYATARLMKSESKVAEPQAAHMPREYEPPSDLPHEHKVVVDKLVPVFQMPKGQGVPIYPMAVRGGSLQSTAIDCLRRNYVLVAAIRSDGMKDEVYGARIGPSVSTVGHIFEGAKLVRLTNPHDPNSVVQMEFDSGSVRVDMSIDRAFVSNHFPTSTREVHRTLGAPCSAVVGDKVVLLGLTAAQDLYGEVIGVNCRFVYGTKFSPTHTFDRGIRVQWDGGKQTVPGSCGRWLMRVRGGGTYDFLGYHVAAVGVGFPGQSWSMATSGPELLAAATAAGEAMGTSNPLAAIPQSQVSFDNPIETTIPERPTSGTFAYDYPLLRSRQALVGRTPVQSAPPVSRLVPSPFEDIARAEIDAIDPTLNYGPAIMKTDVRFDDELGVNRYMSPFEDGLNRPDPDLAVFNATYLAEFATGIVSHVERFVPRGRGKILTVDEALLSHDRTNPVSLDKSSGLLDGGKKGDYVLGYVEDGVEVRQVDDRLRAEVRRQIVERSLGLIGSHATSASLKDEALPEKKRVGMRTRIFEVVDMATYLIDRMFSATSLPLLQDALRPLGCMIGINAASSDWTAAFNATDPALHGGVAEDVDYRWMDKRTVYGFMMWALWIIWRCVIWITAMDDGLAFVYARHILGALRPVRRVDGAVLFGYGANLSGSFWTTIINTINNMANWYHAMRLTGHVRDFQHACDTLFCRSLYYGDDTRWLRLQDITFPQLEAAMKRAGMLIQSAGVIKGDVGTGTGSFLKRGFRKVGHRVFCPLELASIYKSLLYFEPSPSVNTLERHYSVLRGAWEEAFFHADEVRDRIRYVVSMCLQRLPPKYHQRQFRSDAELLARWDSRDFKVWALG
jgi:hypothetical protein